MDLFDLDDLIPSLGIDPSDEHLEELYEIFKRDFIDTPYFLDGTEIFIDLRPSREEGYENYPHTFVKLVSRGNKGKRNFDRKRANKLHWIKVILDNCDTEDILRFEILESDESIREYFWFKEGDFLVILKRITPNYIIVSGFHIDDDRNRRYYEGKYNNRI